jgi:hypothetical protein
MAISERARKILWGRSASKCALCRRDLVENRTDQDRDSVVGDEAHIAAQSPGGPRFRPLEDPDSYDNLIVLCRVDHKKVDDQPGKYSEQELRRIKTEHERFVTQRLNSHPEALSWHYEPPDKPVQLARLHSGSDIWNIIEGAGQSLFPQIEERDGFSEEECDVADALLDSTKDYVEVCDAVADGGLGQVREAKRRLGEHLTALEQYGLALFGGRRQVATGGLGSPMSWWEALLVIRRANPEQPDAPIWVANAAEILQKHIGV